MNKKTGKKTGSTPKPVKRADAKLEPMTPFISSVVKSNNNGNHSTSPNTNAGSNTATSPQKTRAPVKIQPTSSSNSTTPKPRRKHTDDDEDSENGKTLFARTDDDDTETKGKTRPKVVKPEVEAVEEVVEEEFDPFLFIKNLAPLTEEMKMRPSALPEKEPGTPRISLALDLDETLVHCSVEPLTNAELTFTVTFNAQDYEVFVRTRPHLDLFLKQVSQWFEIIVFTASQQVYADKLLNILDPERKYIRHRVFRDSCVCVDGNYLKDLHILGRDLRFTAIVDNSVQAFGFQLNNGIPIESWFDDDADTELLNLLTFLKTLKDVSTDVRPLIKETFRLEDFVSSLPRPAV